LPMGLNLFGVTTLVLGLALCGFSPSLLHLLPRSLRVRPELEASPQEGRRKVGEATGLDPITVHRLWRAASTDEKDDDSRIANLDLEGLAERHHVLLVTYAGEKNCLAITVFRQLSEIKFDKVWSVDKAPDGLAFAIPHSTAPTPAPRTASSTCECQPRLPTVL